MSVNQSAESTTSSMQRSGLSITVGDTKSIVLALQALQSKIRSLEQDRDFHQDQYEVSLQAHERYKLDMEKQMEQERADHRQRESELLELLRKAREERAELEEALSGNKQDLGGFRQELEDMIAAEKELALKRETKLNKEVAKLRGDMTEEQTRRAALLVTVDKLKDEREAAMRTNEQLRVAMDDLLTRYEHLQRQKVEVQQRQQKQQEQQRRQQPLAEARSARTRGVSSSGRLGRGRGGVASAGAATTDSPSRRITSRTRSPGALAGREARLVHAPPLRVGSVHHNYEDPTLNSILRDVRVASDEAPPCSYPSAHNSILPDQEGETGALPREQDGAAGSSRAAEGHSGRLRHQHQHQYVSPAQRSGSANGSQHADTQLRSSHRVRPSPRASPAHRVSLLHRAPATPSPPAPRASLFGSAAMTEVEAQLRQELESLQHQYADTADRGASEEIPQEVLAAALQRITSLIDKKKEQLKLLQEARMELESAVGNSTPGAAGGVAGRNASSYIPGEDKSTRRTMLVNELRSLLAEASS